MIRAVVFKVSELLLSSNETVFPCAEKTVANLRTYGEGEQDSEKDKSWPAPLPPFDLD